MRHLNSGRKLNRTSSHRKALFKNMVLALIRHERIKTTDPKAKELRRIADRMVTLGKQGDLAARRRAFAFMQSHTAVKKLFDEIAPRFKERNGGYTRVIKFGKPPRRRRNAVDNRIHRQRRTNQIQKTKKTPAKTRRLKRHAGAASRRPPADTATSVRAASRPTHERSADVFLVFWIWFVLRCR